MNFLRMLMKIQFSEVDTQKLYFLDESLFEKKIINGKRGGAMDPRCKI